MAVQMENFTPEDLCRYSASRKIAYNAYLSSLDPCELRAFLNANKLVDDTLMSMELYMYDAFVSGKIDEDTIGAEILVLLGEL